MAGQYIRVKNGSVRARATRRFYPQEQTWLACPGMSVWCHEETHAPQQITTSFDHFVGAGQQCRRNCEPEQLGGLKIDCELELRRLHDGEIGRLLALQNPAAVDASFAI